MIHAIESASLSTVFLQRIGCMSRPGGLHFVNVTHRGLLAQRDGGDHLVFDADAIRGRARYTECAASQFRDSTGTRSAPML